MSAPRQNIRWTTESAGLLTRTQAPKGRPLPTLTIAEDTFPSPQQTSATGNRDYDRDYEYAASQAQIRHKTIRVIVLVSRNGGLL